MAKYTYLAHIDAEIEAMIIKLRNRGVIGNSKMDSLNYHINEALKQRFKELLKP